MNSMARGGYLSSTTKKIPQIRSDRAENWWQGITKPYDYDYEIFSAIRRLDQHYTTFTVFFSNWTLRSREGVQSMRLSETNRMVPLPLPYDVIRLRYRGKIETSGADITADSRLQYNSNNNHNNKYNIDGRLGDLFGINDTVWGDLDNILWDDFLRSDKPEQ
ncbi:hypothetical protein G7K_6837-t1 [Saitoella complicata NRRL Y-17804]|uniref:Uncharacterized protein n=1 Tax=Saitoella complicata (strain BCRC 22490 / CBS 7301 / JCM 7358 / NBRC 10748 / NRRL Y-17804) TaxID=698492 RepID=A0A0E9NSD7_SAICN|nr:hypothetical protein G7K_6837-t1 [Saitoella complicata NRRL Y-17804]